MKKIFNNVSELIGNTPLVRLNKTTQIIDEIITIDDDETGIIARKVGREEGILPGISGGAALAAALKIAARKENANKTIVVIIPDNSEHYLSTWLYESSNN